MTFRIGYFWQCQTIYHAKIHYQPENYFPTIKKIRFTASPVLEVLDAPYCTFSVSRLSLSSIYDYGDLITALRPKQWQICPKWLDFATWPSKRVVRGPPLYNLIQGGGPVPRLRWGARHAWRRAWMCIDWTTVYRQDRQEETKRIKKVWKKERKKERKKESAGKWDSGIYETDTTPANQNISRLHLGLWVAFAFSL